MLERIKELLTEDMRAFLIKVMLPAIVAVSIKLAIQMRHMKVTVFQVIVSFVTGIGSAYLFADLVMSEFSHEWIPLIIATITISGEKIGYYAVTLDIAAFAALYLLIKVS